MKRLKTFGLVVFWGIVIFSCICFFTSIGHTETITPASVEENGYNYDVDITEEDMYSDETTYNSFISIQNSKYLVYDSSTKVVYYFFNDYYHNGDASVGYGYLSPYYSENGKLCRYIDGRITEIH